MMRHILLLALWLTAFQPIEASESQTWLQILSRGKLSEKTRLWLEIQPRYSFPVSGFTTVILRPGFGWELAPDLTVWLGYGWQPQMTPRWRGENRVYAQGDYNLHFGKGTLANRMRFETRFLEGISDTAFRLRYQARFFLPLAIDDKLHLVVANEIFFALNSAGTAVQSGFDQNRLFVGAFHRFCPDLGLDIGYLWNALKRTPANQTNHVAMLALYHWF